MALYDSGRAMTCPDMRVMVGIRSTGAPAFCWLPGARGGSSAGTGAGPAGVGALLLEPGPAAVLLPAGTDAAASVQDH